MLSTQVARPLVEVFFGRLDARTVTSEATAKLLEGYFPAGYELVEPARRRGATGGRSPTSSKRSTGGCWRGGTTRAGDPELRAGSPTVP